LTMSRMKSRTASIAPASPLAFASVAMLPQTLLEAVSRGPYDLALASMSIAMTFSPLTVVDGSQ
jgi:hypothetical protein